MFSHFQGAMAHKISCCGTSLVWTHNILYSMRYIAIPKCFGHTVVLFCHIFLHVAICICVVFTARLKKLLLSACYFVLVTSLWTF